VTGRRKSSKEDFEQAQKLPYQEKKYNRRVLKKNK
jgi:hypothetical protein